MTAQANPLAVVMFRAAFHLKQALAGAEVNTVITTEPAVLHEANRWRAVSYLVKDELNPLNPAPGLELLDEGKLVECCRALAAYLRAAVQRIVLYKRNLLPHEGGQKMTYTDERVAFVVTAHRSLDIAGGMEVTIDVLYRVE